MKKYEELALKEVLKHKKRTIFTVISIVFAIATLVFVGEVNYIEQENNLLNNKFNYGDIHSKIFNIDKNAKENLKNNSLINNVGFGYKETITTRTEKEGMIENISEDIEYFDSNYFENILAKEAYNIEGDFPKSEVEIIVDKESYNDKKIGDKININGLEKTIVGFLEYKDSKYKRHTNLCGIADISKNKKFTAYVQLEKEENIMKSMKEIGQSIGITEISDQDISFLGEDESGKSYIWPNIERINLAGEEVEIKDQTYYPKRIDIILMAILMLALIFLTYISINASVKEKRKIYSMLKCMGAGNNQIRKLILKESLIVATLSIIPGIILGEVIFLCVREHLINAMGYLIGKNGYVFNIRIVVTSIILVFIVCIIASFIPMIWVTKLSPIEGIKEGKLKVSEKKIKSKIIRRIFGYEGELAYKNLRNDKRNFIGLTITMIIVIVLFNVFTNFYNYKLKSIIDGFGVMSRDVEIAARSEKAEAEIEEVLTKNIDKGKYLKQRMYNGTFRIEGLDEKVIKDSQNYQYTDEGYVVSKEIFYFKVVNDEFFKQLTPHINGDKITLEKFKNDGAVLFSNNENGALNKPNKEEEIKVYFDSEDNVEMSFDESGKGNKISKIKDNSKTQVVDMNLIGTIYLETILGPNSTWDNNFIGLIISEETFEKININNKFGEPECIYMFELNDEKAKRKNSNMIVEELEKINEDIWIDNSYERKQEEAKIIKAIGAVLYTILTLIIAMIIIALVNVRDIVLNKRKKEFGIMFAVGMDKAMLRKSLIYEGIIQCLIAITIGNILTFSIFEIMRAVDLKFVFSYKVLVVGSVIIIIISILSILNSIQRLSSNKASEMIKSIE